MSILILVLILIFLIVILPYLMPLFVLVAGITLIVSIRGMINKGRAIKEEPVGRRIEYTDAENSSPFRPHTDEVEAPDVLIERPASVRDEAFWEKDHTVYDVPFEEADPTDEDPQ